MYKHPHEVTTINDNSEIKQTTAQNDGPSLFSIFVSDSGIDNQVLVHKSLSGMLKEHGNPNFRDHGQAYYQCLNWLESGGVVRSMRITADDAKYANILVLVNIKVRDEQKTDSTGAPLYIDAATGEETTVELGNTPIMIKKAKVKIFGESFTDLDDLDRDVEHLIRGKYVSTPGDYTIPLYLLACKGRGKYGNSYRFRITPNYKKDRDREVNRHYMFELLNVSEGLKRVEVPLAVSTNPDAKSLENKSEYISDVISRNIYPIQLYVIDEYYETITSILHPIIAQADGSINQSDIDFLFFTNKKEIPYDNIEVDPESLNLSAYEGYGLQAGSDGNFDRSVPERFQNIYAKIVKGFEGKIDDAVLDNKRVPALVCLDANFPLEVKNAMEVWKASRKADLTNILDCGVSYTLLDLKQIRYSEITSDDWSTLITCHHMKVNDKYTGKEIEVTEPYIYSVMLPRHIKANGMIQPMAGSDYPINDIIVKDSVRPKISKPEDKTEFYEMQLNYIEEEFDKVNIATHITSQSKTTSLSYLNNVLMLQEIKRTIVKLAPSLRYKPNESDEDIAYFNRIVNKELEQYKHPLKLIDAIVSKSNDENMPRKLDIRLRVQFKSYVEIIETTIDVER